MRIGAHVSSAGGVQHIFERANEIGAEAIQTFISAPQQWRPPSISDEQLASYIEQRNAAGVPVYLHAIYLINLATDDQTKLNRGKGALKQYLKWGAALAVEGVIFHVGSHKGEGYETVAPRVVEAMREVLDYGGDSVRLIMENNAGQGSGVGSTFSELGDLLKRLDSDPRVHVCLDTCHAFAMGYDLRSKDGCDRAMEEFDREIGLDRLAVVHANDSKVDLGKVRDRHENIGDGFIGYDGFRTIVGHPAFHDLSFLLEVPGVEGNGPDRENVDRLKRIREEVGVPAPPAGARVGPGTTRR